MPLFRSRNDKRRWRRRLVDDETHDFVDLLEERSELFRTASGELQLRGLCLDVFADAPFREIELLRGRGILGEDFYRRELAPNWEGLEREARGAKIEQFLELSHMLGEAQGDTAPSEAFLEVVAVVHVKVLLLAWAYDRTYSFIDRIFNGPLQYREHRYRIAGGRLKGGRAPAGG